MAYSNRPTEDNPRNGQPSNTTDYTSVVIVNEILQDDQCKHVGKCRYSQYVSPFNLQNNYDTEKLQKTEIAAKWVLNYLSVVQKADFKNVSE